MDTVLAAIATAPGPAERVIALRSIPLAPRAQGTVRVRMRAAAINPSDLITISGAYSRTAFPFTAGFEGVGEVVDRDGESQFNQGDLVLPVRTAGAWSTVRDVPEEDCVLVPAEVPLEQAATAYVNPLTALIAVDRYVVDSRPVVVTAASSTIADHLAALLHARGVPAIGVVRSAQSRVRRRELWTSIVAADQPSWVDELRSAAGDAAVVFDAVGGDHAADVAASVRSSGTVLVSYGLLSGVPIPEHTLPASVRLEYLHLRGLIHGSGPDSIQPLFDRVFALIAGGVIETTIARRFPIEQIRDAVRWAGANTGKVLLEFPAV